MPLIEVFGELGLRQAGSTAIDVGRLLAAVSGSHPQAPAVRRTLGQAVSGVLAALVALCDPELIVIGGSWGTDPRVLDSRSPGPSPGCPAMSPSARPGCGLSRRSPEPGPTPWPGCACSVVSAAR